MKAAIYIEEGRKQLVLTPENKYESDIVHDIAETSKNASIVFGSFYDCKAGFIRQAKSGILKDESLMILIRGGE